MGAGFLRGADAALPPLAGTGLAAAADDADLGAVPTEADVGALLADGALDAATLASGCGALMRDCVDAGTVSSSVARAASTAWAAAAGRSALTPGEMLRTRGCESRARTAPELSCTVDVAYAR